MALSIKSLFRRKYDCYKGRHNMEIEKLWETPHFRFIQQKCKRCGTRKAVRSSLVD